MPGKPATTPPPTAAAADDEIRDINLAAIKQRRYRQRKKSGKVAVSVGSDWYEVSEAGAERLRRAVKAIVWAEAKAGT